MIICHLCGAECVPVLGGIAMRTETICELSLRWRGTCACPLISRFLLVGTVDDVTVASNHISRMVSSPLWYYNQVDHEFLGTDDVLLEEFYGFHY